MNKDLANAFVNDLLGSIREHRELVNPAALFTRSAKWGVLDKLSDKEYELTLREYEALSVLFDENPSSDPSLVLNALLKRISFNSGEFETLRRIFVNALIRTDSRMLNFTSSSSSSSKFYESVSARDVYEYLKLNVYGQEEAKRMAASIVHHHRCGSPSRVVFAGPTGCGKSEIWRMLIKKYKGIYMFDGTSLAGSGWRGSLHWYGIFDSIPDEEREHCIIVLDEADKMLEKISASNYTDVSLPVQNTLLKIMEGDKLHFEGEKGTDADIDVDPSHISLVLLGAFETLLKNKSANENSGVGFGQKVIGKRNYNYANTTVELQDLVNYGNMRKEIAGRISSVVLLHPMTADDFLNLFDIPSISPICKLAKEFEIDFVVSDEIKKDLAKKAADSGFGVRYAYGLLRTWLMDYLFDNPDAKKCVLDSWSAGKEDSDGEKQVV